MRQALGLFLIAHGLRALFIQPATFVHAPCDAGAAAGSRRDSYARVRRHSRALSGRRSATGRDRCLGPCPRGPRRPEVNEALKFHEEPKIQWFVAQDQSGIRKGLLCISAPVRSVQSSENRVRGRDQRRDGTLMLLGVTESLGRREMLDMAYILSPSSRWPSRASSGQRLSLPCRRPAASSASGGAAASMDVAVPRDPPWAVLVPALARAWAAAKGVRSKGGEVCHARRP